MGRNSRRYFKSELSPDFNKFKDRQEANGNSVSTAMLPRELWGPDWAHRLWATVTPMTPEERQRQEAHKREVNTREAEIKSEEGRKRAAPGTAERFARKNAPKFRHQSISEQLRQQAPHRNSTSKAAIKGRLKNVKTSARKIRRRGAGVGIDYKKTAHRIKRNVWNRIKRERRVVNKVTPTSKVTSSRGRKTR